VTSEASPKRSALLTLVGRRRWIALGAVAAIAASLLAVALTTGKSATASAAAAQGYTVPCTQGGAAPAVNANLISNPGAEYTTRRGDLPGGAGTAGGSTVPDPDGVLLPDCWQVTSTIAGSDPANEIASALTTGYPGVSGKVNFYGGKSANDKAPTGTVTMAVQTIALSSLDNVAGQPFALSATLGGYANQDDNTVVSAAWKDSSGSAITDASGHAAVAKLGPVLAVDRGDVSSEVLRRAYGAVPASAAQVVITLTFTHGGAGNNDASADNLSLIIGSTAVAPTPQNYDETATCPNRAAPAGGANLVSNPGAEEFTQVAVPYATGGGATNPGTASATVAVPDCWISHDDLPAPDAVVESYATAKTSYPGVDGQRLFFGGTNSGATVPNPAPGFTNDVQGTTTTATQTIDVSSLDPGGHPFEFAARLGGYSTQGDFAAASAAFQDSGGNPISTVNLGPITEPERVANADYLTYLGGTTANSGLLPVQTFGKLPIGTAKVLITVTVTAISAGNDSNGVADDLNFTIDPTAPGAKAQSYDLTSGTHGAIANCPATDAVIPALDHNLIANPGAEDYTSNIWFGGPGDHSAPLPDCWISSSALPAPEATAESYPQASSGYPPVRDSSRVFWGGTNPDGGVAGVTTKATQLIDLSSLGNVDGASFKLSALLGGYATQNDNAVVTATFTDAAGKMLSIASIGPVKAGQRGNVSRLVAQAWYGAVPSGSVKVLVTIAMTAVSTGNDNNGEADDLNLTIGDSTKPSGPILQTLPYDAAAGGEIQIDPTTGLPLPPAGGLYRPAGVSARDGVVYASNTGDNVLAALQNGQSAVVAGTLAGYGNHGDGGPAAKATLYQPGGTAVDSHGNVFVVDSGDNVVREITADGTIKRIAGTGAAGAGAVGSYPFSLLPATRTALNHPDAVAVAANGDVYVADTNNNRVLRVTSRGQIFAVAGTGHAGYSGDRGLGVFASLNGPSAVALDAKADVYIADAANNLVRRVDARTGVITTVAGNYAAGKAHDGLGGFSGDGGPATKAQLNDPQGVAVDGAGNLFIADTFNNAIRAVAADGTISTVVNSAGPNGAIPTAGGESSGVAPTASQLNSPHAVAVDPSQHTLYIADTTNSSIAEVLGVAK
jgi:sugar lactone lactonase YvrE